MDEARFWEVVRKAGRLGKDEQPEALRAALAELEPVEIAGFDRVFRQLLARAYTWDLWAAAYIIEGGASDDGFEYFRAGLVGLGREVYEAALRDPETLAKLPARAINFTNEELLYVAADAYEDATGEELPERDEPPPGKPAGKQWDEETVHEKYPALSKKFGGQ